MNEHNHNAKFQVRFLNRIPVRLGIGVLLIIFAALALVLSIINVQQERTFTKFHISEAHKIAAVITGDLSKLMLAGGGASVWSTVSAEAARHVETTGAYRIQVLNRAGQIKATSDKSAQGTDADTNGNPICSECDSTKLEAFPTAGKFLTENKAKILRIVNRIPTSPACNNCHQAGGSWRGFISVDFNLAALAQNAVERRQTVLMIGVAAGIVLVILISLLFKTMVMRPITSIAQTAQRLADGDLRARTAVLGRNEISLLARHFNHMADRIAAQVNRIKAAQLESSLLYTLVGESAKSLETTEMAAGVFRVIHEKLEPKHTAFFLETADGRWICATTTNLPDGDLATGDGRLDDLLTGDETQIGNLLNGIPSKLVSEACQAHTLQFARKGRLLSFALPLVSDDKLIGMLACIADWSKVHLQKDLLNHLGANLALAATNSRNYSGAVTDSLTKLRNKGYGLVRLDEAIYAAKRYGTGLGLAMADIDFFKRVNDRHGHLAGDAVLKTVGRRITAILRRSDIAVRYGGEEFMVIIPQATPEAMALVGEKLRDAVAAKPVEIGTEKEPLSVTLSVGVAAFRSETDTAESLIGRADEALYRAKQNGRNRVEVVDYAQLTEIDSPSLDNAASNESLMEPEVQAADL